MNKRHIRYLFLVLVVAGFPAHVALSQVAWTDADCYYNGTVVNGYASVSVGYEMGYYYDTSIALVMYDPYNNIVAAETNYTNGYSHAHDDVDYTANTPGIYTIRIYVDVQIYYSDYCGWIDYWGFSHVYQEPVTAWDYYELQGSDPEYCWTYCCMGLLELISETIKPPDVVIGGPQSKNDGDNAPFHVTVESGTFTVTGYTWAFDYSSAAGNNPEVSFSPQGQTNTSASCKWFASPNEQCTPPRSSTYTIGCTVTFQGIDPICKTTTLTVSLPWNDLGGTIAACSLSTWNQTTDGQGLLHFAGIASFSRTINTVINPPTSSQWRNKAVAHENVHRSQYQGGILASLYTSASLEVALYTLPGYSTQAALTQAIQGKMSEWVAGQNAIVNGMLWTAVEPPAFQISDGYNPKFIWQWVCVR